MYFCPLLKKIASNDDFEKHIFNFVMISFRNIMHGDLAARNVLIGENYSAKIRLKDFLSKLKI